MSTKPGNIDQPDPTDRFRWRYLLLVLVLFLIRARRSRRVVLIVDTHKRAINFRSFAIVAIALPVSSACGTAKIVHGQDCLSKWPLVSALKKHHDATARVQEVGCLKLCSLWGGKWWMMDDGWQHWVHARQDRNRWSKKSGQVWSRGEMKTAKFVTPSRCKLGSWPCPSLGWPAIGWRNQSLLGKNLHRKWNRRYNYWHGDVTSSNRRQAPVLTYCAYLHSPNDSMTNKVLQPTLRAKSVTPKDIGNLRRAQLAYPHRNRPLIVSRSW